VGAPIYAEHEELGASIELILEALIQHVLLRAAGTQQVGGRGRRAGMTTVTAAQHGQREQIQKHQTHDEKPKRLHLYHLSVGSGFLWFTRRDLSVAGRCSPKMGFMRYYTTAAQEAALADIYNKELAVCQAQLDETERRTGNIPKGTAKAHVSRPVVRFDVSGDQVVHAGSPCPLEPVDGGGTYIVDWNFDKLMEQYTIYSVEFMPSGRYGPCVDYCSKEGSTPAMLYVPGYPGFMMDIDFKYDLGCC
jgi:hypothetical protein